MPTALELPACRPARSPRLVEVAMRFGLALEVPAKRVTHGLAQMPTPGSITLIRGPSGAGKTLLMEAMARRWPEARLVQACPFPVDVAIIDAVAPTRGIDEAMGLLTACGLGEPALWLHRFDQLSEGERFRARLARAIGLHRRERGHGPLLCDEFGSNLHVRSAQALAFNLRKLATRERMALVVATCREDIAADLRADTTIEVGTSDTRVGECATGSSDPRFEISDPLLGSSDSRFEIPDQPRGSSNAEAVMGIREGEIPDQHPAISNPAFQISNQPAGASDDPRGILRHPSSVLSADVVPSFAQQFTVEPASLRDYARFAPLHYRRRESIGFIDKVFALRTARSEVLAIVVYGHAGLELRARNEATGGRFVSNPRRLNAELRVLKRLIVHPDARGCGLGHRLVRATLPLAGVRLVECLAALGLVNPVFEKAGMRRVGICALPAGQERLLGQLRQLGVDPLSAEFPDAVRDRADVRKLVEHAVVDWYRGITGGGKGRVERQSPHTLAHTYRQLMGSRPVYYLWAADDEGWANLDESSSYHEGGLGASGCPQPLPAFAT